MARTCDGKRAIRSSGFGALPVTVAAMSLAVLSSAVAGQSNVQPANKFAWGENIGFINCRDADSGAQGVVVRHFRLSGFAWSENCGWINFGDGSPATPPHYSNATGADHGVNVEANGDCFGLAWGENIGWINFDTRTQLGPFGQQARVDRSAKRLRGYAWGENVGWINLDDANVFVAYDSLCPGDFNNDGVVDLADLLDFLGLWNPALGQAVTPGTGADLNGDGVVDLADLLDFLGEWNPNLGMTCP
ncbi:MAG: hypothetical protein KF768_04555 [Phycisphaeraceae bacterium]|nr:hypothetical protein [Phycisphaeraceae bacterium]